MGLQPVIQMTTVRPAFTLPNQIGAVADRNFIDFHTRFAPFPNVPMVAAGFIRHGNDNARNTTCDDVQAAKCNDVQSSSPMPPSVQHEGLGDAAHRRAG